MSQITLVRHGQANSDSSDEQGYDKLSTLGHVQAEWLGAHMRSTHQAFDSVYCGTLRRHVETAAGMKAEHHAPIVQDARLNELAYFDLSKAFQIYSGKPVPTQQEEFAAHMPQLFDAWMQGQLKDIPESFAHFEDRVSRAIEDISARADRALVITSGGVIGLMTRMVLDLSTENYARTCLSIMNSSTHRFTKIGPKISLSQFNNIAHLEQVGRHHAQTHI